MLLLRQRILMLTAFSTNLICSPKMLDHCINRFTHNTTDQMQPHQVARQISGTVSAAAASTDAHCLLREPHPLYYSINQIHSQRHSSNVATV